MGCQKQHSCVNVTKAQHPPPRVPPLKPSTHSTHRGAVTLGGSGLRTPTAPGSLGVAGPQAAMYPHSVRVPQPSNPVPKYPDTQPMEGLSSTPGELPVGLGGIVRCSGALDRDPGF